MRKFIRGVLWIAGFLAVVGLVARVLFVTVWVIPDEPLFAASVEPSLSGGDVVLVLTRGSPGFGQLVRCTDPEDPARFVVGRIAGLSSDTVEVDGDVIVNGKGYPSQQMCLENPVVITHPRTGGDTKLTCSQVQMGGGWHMRGVAQNPGISNRTPTLVGADQVFIVSDDRTFHDDSRDFGTLPAASCHQQIFFRLWGKGGWSDDKRRMSYIR